MVESDKHDKTSSSASVREQGNISPQCPKLTKTNYTTWALMMETILKAYGLWKVIDEKDGKKETSGKQETAIDEKAENTTKGIIFQTLPQDMLMQAAQYTTAKEEWNSIKVKHIGADLVQKARLQTLRSELETLKMKLNESANEIAGKLTSIEQYQEIDTMQIKEAVGRITAFEERLKRQDEPKNNYQKKLLLASSNNQGGGRGHGRNFTKNKSSYGKSTSRRSIDKGFRGARKLKCGSLYLYVGNGIRAEVEAIGSFDLYLPNGLIIILDNCYYAPTITIGVVSVSKLVFKNEVENQLGKTIKALRSDHSGEYISKDFKDYLKACGIVQQLTPPYTPQHNGVSERRNRTLLNMVRSMMSLTTLPLSFWDYALETAARILNMDPTKKVDKTPYELWHGKVPNLSYLKECGRTVELDDEDTIPSENTSKHPIKAESLAPIIKEDVVPVRRSARTPKAPNRLCLNVEIVPDQLYINVKVEEHSLGDKGEPASYKATLSDPEFEKWLVAMNAEIQSMYDNKV
uniref:Zinc finger, CCHC-type n=1 Tax=Tanacetum cinerariifolium TaxID=118510 RepID=A0A699INI6_TANCI|nr:zinc finger, CCHC-type [Tanacetum cinerariifolium]